MTILNLTFLRRHREKDSVDRLDLEPGREASTRVLSRLERLLAKESSSSEERPVPSGSPGDVVLAQPRNDEVEDVSAVSVMAPPEEVEVSLIAALDDACAEGEARRLAEHERDHVRHQSRNRLDRLENELADAVGKVQTEAALRRSVEIELERVREEARRLAENVQAEAGLRRAAEIEVERVHGEARCLAEQARDRVQHESRHQLASLEAELADAVAKVQTDAVLLRAADAELERAQEGEFPPSGGSGGAAGPSDGRCLDGYSGDHDDH